MKPYRFSKDKDKFLKEKRGVGFSEIIKALEERQILKSTDYPNKKKFPNQKMMLVKIKKYIYVVPYVESEKEFFLKTIYPSRKYTENDEWVEIPNQKEEIEKLVGAAKYTREMMKKEKRITVRVNKQDLEDIQEKAIQTGIPYQTLIASILHKFAKGKINIGV